MPTPDTKAALPTPQSFTDVELDEIRMRTDDEWSTNRKDIIHVVHRLVDQVQALNAAAKGAATIAEAASRDNEVGFPNGAARVDSYDPGVDGRNVPAPDDRTDDVGSRCALVGAHFGSRSEPPVDPESPVALPPCHRCGGSMRKLYCADCAVCDVCEPGKDHACITCPDLDRDRQSSAWSCEAIDAYGMKCEQAQPCAVHGPESPLPVTAEIVSEMTGQQFTGTWLYVDGRRKFPVTVTAIHGLLRERDELRATNTEFVEIIDELRADRDQHAAQATRATELYELAAPVLEAAQALIDAPCPCCDDNVCENECGVVDWHELAVLSLDLGAYKEATNGIH